MDALNVARVEYAFGMLEQLVAPDRDDAGAGSGEGLERVDSDLGGLCHVIVRLSGDPAVSARPYTGRVTAAQRHLSPRPP
ncbi:MAG: hypothetical protein H0V26_11795 [Solirubrobacterales bacterium]|nr:hypothetical protein [Solirubrobacterales bacterium]